MEATSPVLELYALKAVVYAAKIIKSSLILQQGNESAPMKAMRAIGETVPSVSVDNSKIDNDASVGGASSSSSSSSLVSK
eukprot:3774614-Ditylum_brightwellii.AAC.1